MCAVEPSEEIKNGLDMVQSEMHSENAMSLNVSLKFNLQKAPSCIHSPRIQLERVKYPVSTHILYSVCAYSLISIQKVTKGILQSGSLGFKTTF